MDPLRYYDMHCDALYFSFIHSLVAVEGRSHNRLKTESGAVGEQTGFPSRQLQNRVPSAEKQHIGNYILHEPGCGGAARPAKTPQKNTEKRAARGIL